MYCPSVFSWAVLKCARILIRKFKWLITFGFFCSVGAFHLAAQANIATAAVNDAQHVVLSDTVHPLARPQYDRGLAPASLPMEHMLLVLKRSPQQEAALKSLLAAQQDPSSLNYHNWISPAQFGAEFGPADQDIEIIISWLRSKGFTVNGVSTGRTVVSRGLLQPCRSPFIALSTAMCSANSTNIDGDRPGRDFTHKVRRCGLHLVGRHSPESCRLLRRHRPVDIRGCRASKMRTATTSIAPPKQHWIQTFLILQRTPPFSAY
jgi:hypothetical protein